jgi:hypothetical protein
MAPALLTAVDATAHIHLIVGSNPLAAARCSRAIEVGARPVLIAPEDSTLHYALVKRIDAGEVKWLRRSFQDADLTTLGRPEVDGVVDAVFVTAGGKQTPGKYLKLPVKTALTCHSYTGLKPLPKAPYTSERRRRTESVLIHPSFDSLGRPIADWSHNVGQGLQTVGQDPQRHCRFIAVETGGCG